MDKPFLNEEAFLKAQERGRKKLHTALLLLLFFLLVYTMCGFIAIQTILDVKAVVYYCIQAGVEVLVLLVCIISLWACTKNGRRLFTIVSIGSLLAVFSIYQFFQVPLPDTISKTIRIVLTVFFICKSLTLLLCTFNLYQKPMNIVWKQYAKEGKQAQAEDQIMINHLMQENNEEEKKKQSRRKIINKAQHNLRMYTILLTSFLYGSILLFYLGLFILRYYFPNDQNGIDYVQRYVLLATLFSALVWSFSAVLMFLYRGGVRTSLFGAIVLELFRFVVTIVGTISTFHSQKYGISSIFSLLIIECIRYGVLLRITWKILHDPFVNTYWKMLRKKQ